LVRLEASASVQCESTRGFTQLLGRPQGVPKKVRRLPRGGEGIDWTKPIGRGGGESGPASEDSNCDQPIKKDLGRNEKNGKNTRPGRL